MCETVGVCLLLFLPCLQSTYPYVPAEEALQAVDLIDSQELKLLSMSSHRCVVQVAVQGSR